MRPSIKLSIPMLVLAASVGCVVYTDDVHHDDYVESNYSPYIEGAEAGVFYDDYAHDDVWYFDASVDDPDGVYDVVEVWADVFDERSGEMVESFELYSTNDPYFWTSEWYGYDTYLDPFYDGYSVDFVAYDAYDAYDVLTVWAITY